MASAPSDPSPRIEVSSNGPYLVHGDVAVRRIERVHSERGEPITNRVTGACPSEPGGVLRLCRCGQSNSKPWCDNSHVGLDWESDESAPTDTYDDRARSYEAPGLEVRDDRAICEHAGFCGNHLTNIWKLMKAGATDDSVVRAQAVTMVERCPSGALTYRFPGDEADVEPLLPTAISVVADGPLQVSGGIPVRRADGAPFETRNRVTLCRCGASGNKPLCDGSHKKVEFTDR